MKPSVIVADTSPLIALAVMDLISILPDLFESFYVPTAVVNECLLDLTKPKASIIQQAIAEKIIVEKSPSDTTFCTLLSAVLDPGEAEAIALAKELGVAVLMDERAGRNVAVREGVECIGSLYCLIRAKQNGLIKAAAPLSIELQRHGYYLHETLIQKVLKSCKEKMKP